MKKKSLSVKKIIPRRFNLNKILKDKKIFGIYTKFAKDFENFNDSNKIAISVSGGADSMALCFLVYCYKIRKNNKIKPFFYLIDHGLRTNSKQEAETVKKQLKLKKINLNVLKWKGKKPRSNIQSLARKKRYEILFNECKKLKIQTILTAHHQDDVYETFFSRLLRGSGTEGLSSFVNFKKNLLFEGNSIIKIVRPLLSFSKQELTYLTDVVFNFYINDPSNEMEKFQRVRLRKLISNLKNEGLDFGKLRLSLNNLASTNKAINQIVHNNILENTFFDKKKCIMKSDFFLFPDEIVFRSLSYIIKKISKRYYPPRGKKMINLILDLKNKEHFKATLGGTIIEKIHNSVVVSEEKTKKR